MSKLHHIFAPSSLPFKCTLTLTLFQYLHTDDPQRIAHRMCAVPDGIPLALRGTAEIPKPFVRINIW